MPQAPGMQIHSRLGEEGGSVEIIGKGSGHITHGIAIGLSRFPTISLWVFRKALGHCSDVGLLVGWGAGRQLDGFLNGFVRSLETIVAGGIVVVRTNCFCDPPERHREFRIEFCCPLERTGGLVVIEGVDQTQSLVEELLGLHILGRNRMMKLAQAGHQRSRFGCGRMSGMLRYCERATSYDKQDGARLHHRNDPPLLFWLKVPTLRSERQGNEPHESVTRAAE